MLGRGGGIFCWNPNNIKIINNIISENIASGWRSSGGGICSGGSAIISNNTIFGNIAMGNSNGGGISCGPNVILNNNIISGNRAKLGGGISFYGSSAMIVNNAIVGNVADSAGGAISCQFNLSLFVFNTILRENSADYFAEIYFDTSSSAVLKYSNIQGGWEGEGNVDIEPIFRDPENSDFHLMATNCDDPYDSPCIDMGHPDILDSLIDCDWGLGEERSDMGAYGGGEGYVDIEEISSILPEKIILSQNYPNPFNASTTIQYTLPMQSDVTIHIYNLLGRKVETLIDKKEQAGYHQVIWQADDLSSGVYFYKIQAGDYIETKKMVLIK